MSKIRRFEVSQENGVYDVSVDGESTDITEAQHLINNLNDYQTELDDMDHIIEIIMRSIQTTHDLCEDEYREYKQTLKFILKD